MLDHLPPWVRRGLPALALLITIGITVTVVDNGPDHPPGQPRRIITVQLGGPGNDKIELPPVAQAEVKDQAAEDAAGNDVAAHSDLHENAPPAPDDARAADKLTPPGQPEIPAVLPLASAHVAGCTTALVRNYSDRRGAPVLLGVIHWTGSLFGSGPGIVAWFDRAASQASSHEIVDRGGRCWLTVAEAAKAWTQAGFNPWSVSVEIVNPGVQPLFADQPQRDRVVKLMRGWHHRWGIPYRRGHVDGCRVTRTGFLAHRDLGTCGGGHPDVGTFDLDALIREAAGIDVRKRRAARAACRKLTWHRGQAARARRHGTSWWTSRHVARARELKATIAAGRRTCPA